MMLAKNKYTAAALGKAILSGMRPMQARPFQLLGEWATDHFTFAGTSHSSGKWKSWPFQVGILDFLGDPAIKEVSLYKSKRVGGTKMLTAAMAYFLTQGKKVCAWQPTDSDALEFSADEIRPVIEDIKYLQQLRTPHTKSLEKNDYFPLLGASLRIRGGKSSAAYRRLTLDVVLLDELDGFDQSIQGSGPPDVLAMGRLEGAPHPKAIFCSTPRLELGSHLARIARRADAVLHWSITCPHCDVGHPIEWAPATEHGLRRVDGAAVHICPHCHGAIQQADYSRLTKRGFWWCEVTHRTYGADRAWREEDGSPAATPERIVVRPWAAISPQRTWASILDEYDQAMDAMNTGDSGPMVLFTNETLGRTWSDAVDKGDEALFSSRAGNFVLGRPPAKVGMLTAGIDVQGDRVEVHVWGWSHLRECWTVDVARIGVNPMVESDWAQVREYLERSFETEDGRILRIESISMDAGYNTEQVKTFVYACQQAGINIRAIKGSVGALDPFMGGASLQDVNYLGGRRPDGMRIWNVGHATSNDLIHGMLSLNADSGPGVVHFAGDLTHAWYKQMNSEQKRQSINKKTGQVEYRWFTQFKRNEVRDCFRYALHAYMMMDADKWPESTWQNRILAAQRAAQRPEPMRNEVKSSANGANWLQSAQSGMNPSRKLNW